MRKDIVLKILLSLAVFLVLAKGVTVLLLHYRLPKEIRRVCEENGCRLESVNVRADWIGSGLSINDLVVKSKDSADGFFLYLPRFRLEGIHPFSIWLRDRFVVRDLYVESARLEYRIVKGGQSSPWKIPVPVRIRSLVLRNASAVIRDTTVHRFLRVNGADISFRLIDLRENDTSWTQALDHINIHSRDILLMGSDSLYHVGASHLEYDADRKHFSSKEIYVTPNYSDYAFAARLPLQRDCIRARFFDVSATDLDAGECLAASRLDCKSLHVGEMKMHVFRDRRKPDTRIRMPLIQEALRDFPLGMTLDTIVLGTGTIAYKEHVKETDEAATVSFTGVKARCSGVTNDTNTTHRFMELETEAQFLGSAPLHCHVRGKLFDSTQTLHFRGSLGSMPATDFNTILEHSAPIRIKSGVLDQLQFTFLINSRASDGTMKLLYHDLDIGVNKEISANPVSLLHAFMIFLGTGKIMESNPRKDDPVREGVIGVPRNPHKSIFNYCLLSLLSGSQWTMTKDQPKKEKGRQYAAGK